MKLNNLIQNRKGRLVIRDIVLMTLILSAVLVLASTFVSEMAGNYGLTNMSDEYALSNISIGGNDAYDETTGNVGSASDKLQAANESKGLWGIVSGVSEATVTIISVFLTAPNTVADLLYYSLLDSNVSPTLASTVKTILRAIMWMVLIAAILTAFRAGSEV